MKETIDLLAREAFKRMIEEAGEPKMRSAPSETEIAGARPVSHPALRIAERPAARIAERPMSRAKAPARRKRPSVALIFTAAAFVALAVLPPVVLHGGPGFAEQASRLSQNPQLLRYAELLSDSRIK